MSTTESKSKAIDPVNFDISKLTNSDIDTSGKSDKFQKTQYLSFIKNDDGSDFTFKLGPTKYKEGGISNLHDDYAPTDEKRCFFKYSNDPSQPVCDPVFKMAHELDDLYSSDAFKKKLFSCDEKLAKLASKFDYSPLVKKPSEESKAQFEYLKIKFKVDFATKDLKTTLFVNVEKKDEDGNVVVDDKKHPVMVTEKRQAKTVTEMHKYFSWNSTVQAVVVLSKIWVAKSAGVGGKRLYGATLEARQVHVIEKGDTKGKNSYDEFAFGSNDEVPLVQTKVQATKKPTVKKSDDDDDDDDDDSSKEKKTETKGETNVETKQAEQKKVESDDEEDDEEEKNKSAKSKKESSDDDTDEDTKTKSKGKSVKASAKSKKVDSDDDEDLKPKGKTVTKTPKSNKN